MTWCKGTSATTATAHGATERHRRVVPNDNKKHTLASSLSLKLYVPRTPLQGLEEAIGSSSPS